jgi:hypothetical protein
MHDEVIRDLLKNAGRVLLQLAVAVVLVLVELFPSKWGAEFIIVMRLK